MNSIESKLVFKEILLLGILPLLLTSCNQRFAPTQTTCPSLNNCGSAFGQGGGNSNQILQQADVDGTIGNGEYDGLHAMYIDPNKKMLVMLLPVPSLSNLPQLNGTPLPNLPGSSVSTLSTKLDQVTFPVIQVEVPLASFLNGANVGSAAALPTQADVTGQIPATTLDLGGNYKLTLFLKANVCAVFLSTPFDPTVFTTAPLQDPFGLRTLGHFMVFSSASNNNSPGFYLSTQISETSSQILDQLL